VLGDPEHARGELRSIMPPELAEALDWPTLSRCPGSFVDLALGERHTDVLFSVAWRRGGAALVYVLFEHQSTPDDRMAFRLLRYQVRIWERWFADHPRAKTLPVIVPIVLYHGEDRWSGPISFDAMLDIPDAVRSALAPYLVQYRYLLDDLSEVSDEALRDRLMTALCRLTALSFKYARTRPDVLDILNRWSDVVREVALAPNGLEALALVMRYILVVNDHVMPEQLQQLLDRVVGPNAKDTVMTAGERLIQQGEERGILKGIQQGEERGILKGKCDVLLLVLQQRFGSQVSADVERRLTTASAEQITAWASRVMSAATLAELLAD
jgi:predicted transposase/invertase (TIGR01784 family)